MDEAGALSIVAELVGAAGDDAAVLDELVLTTDMLHAETDFPDGTTAYTIGWRSVGASLSDVAAMGARARGAVAVYAAPTFESAALRSFLAGARDVSQAVDATYVGGDLDTHEELTVATTALGETSAPVFRSGATVGDRVYVTGTLGRSGAALQLFQAGETDRANDLFQFTPRVTAGTKLAPVATAMIDSSDGLARSLHNLAAASECGFRIHRDAVPIDPAVAAVATADAAVEELGLFFGEDFELVFTGPADLLDEIDTASCPPITDIGAVTETDVVMDGDPLPDRGYTHGSA